MQTEEEEEEWEWPPRPEPAWLSCICSKVDPGHTHAHTGGIYSVHILPASHPLPPCLSGALEEARQQAELCVQQAEDGGWLDSSGQSLRLRACRTLWRIYSRLADAQLVTEDYSEALTLLQMGHRMAKEGR